MISTTKDTKHTKDNNQSLILFSVFRVFSGLQSRPELKAGGGAKVRASGYGVFAEVPRGGAFGHRQRVMSGEGLFLTPFMV